MRWVTGVKEAPEIMDAGVKDKILGRPRAREWANWSPPDLSLREVRQKYGGAGVSDEELVLRVIGGEAAVKEMMAAGRPKEYGGWKRPLVSLIEQLSRKNKFTHVYIRKGEFSLASGRRA